MIRRMSTITTVMLLWLYCVSFCMSQFLPPQPPVPANGMNQCRFYHMVLNTAPEVKTKTRGRSVLECGQRCFQWEQCTGFRYKAGEGCQFYSSDLTAASGDGFTVYSRNEPVPADSCDSHVDFESMLLDGAYYCIQVVKDSVDGKEARIECDKLGAKVIALETRAKIEDFRAILQARGDYSSAGFWIGLYDVLTEGAFVWDKDNTVIGEDHEVWDSGQPNGGTPGQDDQDCAYLEKERFLQDKNCDEMTAYYVCEIDLS